VKKNPTDMYRVLRFCGAEHPIVQGDCPVLADARRMAREAIRSMTGEIPVWCPAKCWHPDSMAPGRLPIGGFDIESSYKAAVIYKKIA